MRKYGVLTDKELETNLKSWEGLERDCRVHNDAKAAERCQKTIEEINVEKTLRQQPNGSDANFWATL